MSEPAETTPETEAKNPRGLGSYVVWGFVVVMVYVLNSGLAIKLLRRPMLMTTVLPNVASITINTRPTRPKVYILVWWLYDKTLFRKPLGMYLHLWCPAEYDHHGDFIRTKTFQAPGKFEL